MSASSKKKLRKEQVSAQLTDKQRREQSESKKLKIYTVTFVSVMILIAVVVLGILGFRAVDQSGIIDKNTIAASVGEHQLNSVELAYYYGDAITEEYYNWYQSYGEYLSMYLQWGEGLDVTKPLNTQVKDEETGETWADYFVSVAMDKAKSNYTLYDKAMAEGFTLSEEAEAEFEEILHEVEHTAKDYGYNTNNAYLKASYGFGSNMDSYTEYLRVKHIADTYYNAYADALVYNDDALREHEKDRYSEYSSFTGAYAYMSYTDFREGGTENDDGTMTYTDDENNAARAEAKKVAESLMGATSVEELKTMVEEHEANQDTMVVSVIDLDRKLYSSVPSGLQEWFSDESRQANDIALIPNVSTVENDDGTTTTNENGYYVAIFTERNDNLEPLGNVRHLLVSFEGGTEDENGDVVYSDDEINAAKTKAEEYLKTWQEGEATEDSFVALVKEHSDDTTAADGGLFEDVTPDSNYVDSFRKWATDPARETGDAEVIESEFGFHVMYYVGDSEVTYRDYMITNELKSEALDTWYNGILETATITAADLSRLKLDLVIQYS